MINESYVTVRGKRFHYTWLRDHCFCPACYHSSSSQRIYDASLSPPPLEPSSMDETAEALRILWDEAPSHESVFPMSWLLDHAYDPAPGPEHQSEPTLWDREWIEAHLADSLDASSTPFESWASQLTTLGFAVLHHLAPDDLHTWLGAIGPLHWTEYGFTSRVKPTSQAKDLSLSDSGHTVLPHTDGSYRYGERLLEFLYAHENTTSGGDSILVDGFRAARDFRQHHPDEFQVLAQTPIRFRQHDKQSGYLFRHTTPILVLDGSGEVEAVYYSPKNNDWQLPFDEVARFYHAYGLFSHCLNDPAYQHRFRLERGDCLLFQNFRVLHSRSEYETSSGHRDLESGYLDWSYLIGRREHHHVNNPDAAKMQP